MARISTCARRSFSGAIFVWTLLMGLLGCGCPSRPGRSANPGAEQQNGSAPGKSDGPVAVEDAKSKVLREKGAVRLVLKHPARRYNEPRPSWVEAPSSLEKRVYAAVRKEAVRLRHTSPKVDWRLRLVAADMAKLPPGAQASETVLSQLTAARGLVEPVPLVLSVSTNDPRGTAAAKLIEQKVSALLAGRRFSRVGVGFSRSVTGDFRLVLALQESHLSLNAIPRSLDCGETLVLRGSIAEGYKKPTLVVAFPDGATATGPVRSVRGRTAFSAQVTLGKGPGRYQVELLAHGKAGPTVLANFPVYCGQPAPTEVRLPGSLAGRKPAPSAPKNVAAVEKQLLERLNAERKAKGLEPMKAVEELALVARSHSREMCRTGRFGHISPTTGSADDRVREAGYRPRIVGENVAQASSVETAHRALMGSPSHRANIMSRELTQVGVGVSICRMRDGSTQLFVTQLFVKP